MCSARAPSAGHEPPAAATGNWTRRSANEEGRWDPGLQREWSHTQQRCTHTNTGTWLCVKFDHEFLMKCVFGTERLQTSVFEEQTFRDDFMAKVRDQHKYTHKHTHTHTHTTSLSALCWGHLSPWHMIHQNTPPGDDGWNSSPCGSVFTAFMCGISHLWLLCHPSSPQLLLWALGSDWWALHFRSTCGIFWWCLRTPAQTAPTQHAHMLNSRQQGFFNVAPFK